jgi:hypothetical protein
MVRAPWGSRIKTITEDDGTTLSLALSLALSLSRSLSLSWLFDGACQLAGHQLIIVQFQFFFHNWLAYFIGKVAFPQLGWLISKKSMSYWFYLVI